MMNAYTMRNLMELGNYNTSITREAFEAHFTKTKESVRFTFNGWDGKSYDGESRSAKVIRTNLPGYEEVRLVKVGKHLCYIEEDTSILEKATGEKHPEASGKQSKSRGKLQLQTLDHRGADRRLRLGSEADQPGGSQTDTAADQAGAEAPLRCHPSAPGR